MMVQSMVCSVEKQIDSENIKEINLMQPMVMDWSWIGHEGEGEDFQVVGLRNLTVDGPFAVVRNTWIQ